MEDKQRNHIVMEMLYSFFHRFQFTVSFYL